MSGKRYPEEFKIEAVKQVVDRGYSVASVQHVSYHHPQPLRLDKEVRSRILPLIKNSQMLSRDPPSPERVKRVTDERDILKKAAAVLRKAVRLRYAFIRDNTCCWPVRLLCRVLDVHPSGFTPGFSSRIHKRHQADLRLTGQIKQFWLESGCVYGYRKNPSGSAGQRATVRSEQSLATDETCRDKGSGRIPEPRARKGEASIVSPNRLQRQFNPGCSG
ncbi:transposase insF for insertion sequence IS3A/B/C/D/E/fA [Escherichia coli]|uniref:Transposase insF for insertion sequence IS3A/B/C/D/E/fA n=1 Tax=Escherichia coli TaxID=562 RepID=A0A2X1NAN1_ECOLX|nr:transposase insF for insertion sequence IS3A/B/C/D/E/fA [Escherichia coli]